MTLFVVILIPIGFIIAVWSLACFCEWAERSYLGIETEPFTSPMSSWLQRWRGKIWLGIKRFRESAKSQRIITPVKTRWVVYTATGLPMGSVEGPKTKQEAILAYCYEVYGPKFPVKLMNNLDIQKVRG